jgi:hypothetical protein
MPGIFLDGLFRDEVHLTAAEFFEASAVVGYTHIHLGMGLVSSEVNSESQAVRHKWIAFAERGKLDDA